MFKRANSAWFYYYYFGNKDLLKGSIGKFAQQIYYTFLRRASITDELLEKELDLLKKSRALYPLKNGEECDGYDPKLFIYNVDQVNMGNWIAALNRSHYTCFTQKYDKFDENQDNPVIFFSDKKR